MNGFADAHGPDASERTTAAGRNRTGNLEITNHALCQLSYGGGVVRSRG
jgi:hypothetical protein